MNVLRSLALLGLASSLAVAQTPSPAPPCPAASPLLKSPPIYGVGVKTIAAACPAFVLGAQVWFATLSSRIDAERWNASQIMTALTTGVLPPAPIVPPAPVVVPPPTVIVSPQTGSGALASVDFSAWPSDSLIKSVAWWKGSGFDNGGVDGFRQPIFYDASEQAMRYDWPNRSTSACVGAEVTTAMMPRIRLSSPTSQLWIRFTTKESAGFAHGLPNCGGRSYKYFLVNVENGATMGRAGLYLGDGRPASHLSTRAYLDFNSPSGASGVKPDTGAMIGGDAGWGGSYHTWTMAIEGIGSSGAKFSVYLDGRLVHQITGPFLAGIQVGTGWVVMFQLGANINNGPDHAQSRWRREFGVYTTKPSGLP
jgi:hypothetical protein